MKSKFGEFKGLIQKNSKVRYTPILSLVVIMLLTVGTIGLSQRLLKPVGEAERSKAAGPAVPWTYPRKLKVIILRYFNPASQPSVNDPAKAKIVTDNLQGIIYQASKYHGSPTAVSAVQVEVAGQYDFQTAAPNVNGDWDASYNQMLSTVLPGETRTVCDKINAEGIDQVWFMGDATAPNFIKGPEFAISSRYVQPSVVPTEFENSTLPKQRYCGGQRSLVVSFLDLSQPLISMHAFGHYMESLLGTIQGFDLVFKNYMGITYQGSNGVEVPGVTLSDRCGSVHVPPNVPANPGTSPKTYPGYTYSSPNEVQSSCYNWNPDGTGAKTPVSPAVWKYNGGSDELNYHMWWAQNMPNIGNNITYNNLPLPNWWDFLVDIDATVAYYLSTSYYMNPQLLTLGNTASVGPTSSCTGTNGTQGNCNLSTTLGASTENEKVQDVTDEQQGEVLQATTQATTYGNLLLVTAAYRAHNVPTAAVSSLTYCGYSLSRLGGGTATGRASFTDQHMEMWYLFNPPTNCNVLGYVFKDANGNLADPEDRLFTRTVFSGIPQIDFLSGIVRLAGYNYPPGSNFFNPSNTGPKGSRFICSYSNYPNGGQNQITSVASGWRQIWGSGKVLNNIQSAIGVSDPRTSDGQLVSMKWNATQSWPWAAVCIDLKTNASTVVTPPSPTPTPVPKTTVNLKVNGSDGPVTVKAGDVIALSWVPVSANTCTASGGKWTGGKSIAPGTDYQVALAGSTTYKLTCVGNATYSDSVIVKGTPKMELRVNGSQGLIDIDKGIAPTVFWKVSGATSCTASGGWSGSKAITTGQENVSPLTGNTTYTLSCKGVGGTTTMSVPVTANNTAQDGFYVQYFSDSNFVHPFATQILPGYKIGGDFGTTGSFYPNLSKTNISVRHSAQITPAKSGEHQFIFTVDDGIRVYLDNKLLANDWQYYGRHVVSGKATLTAGKQYNMVIDYFQSTGSSTLIYQVGITGTNSPAGMTYKAIDFPFAMNGGGIKADYYADTAYTQLKDSLIYPVMDQIISTNAAIKPVPAPYAIYTAYFTPKVSSTYKFLAKEMYINNVKKTGVAQANGTYIVSMAMTANKVYLLRWESAKTGFVMKWTYGTLPYAPIDFTNSRPSDQ